MSPSGLANWFLVSALALLGFSLTSPLSAADEWKSEPIAKATLPANGATSPDGKYRVAFLHAPNANVDDVTLSVVDEKGKEVYRLRGNAKQAVGQAGFPLATPAFFVPADRENGGSVKLAYYVKSIAQGRHDHFIHVVDLGKGKLLHNFKVASQAVTQFATPVLVGEVEGMAFAPDGKTLLVHQDDKVNAWDVTTGKKTGVTLPAPKKKLGDARRLQPCGKGVVVVFDQGIAVADFDDLEKWKAEAEVPWSSSVLVSPDQSTLLVEVVEGLNRAGGVEDNGNNRRKLVALESATLKQMTSLDVGKVIDGGEVLADFVPGRSDRLFTTTTRDQPGVVTIWDLKTGKKTGSFTHEPSAKTKKNFRAEFRAVATRDGKIATFWFERQFQFGPPMAVDGKTWTPTEKKE